MERSPIIPAMLLWVIAAVCLNQAEDKLQSVNGNLAVLKLPTLLLMVLLSLSSVRPASDPDQPPTHAVPQTYARATMGTRSPPSRAPRRIAGNSATSSSQQQQQQHVDGDAGAPLRTSARNIFHCMAICGRSASAG